MFFLRASRKARTSSRRMRHRILPWCSAGSFPSFIHKLMARTVVPRRIAVSVTVRYSGSSMAKIDMPLVDQAETNPRIKGLVGLTHKRRRIIQLRLAGISTTRIGKIVGSSQESICEALRQMYAANVTEPTNECRLLELERIDRMWEQWWPRRAEKDAAEILIKLHRRRCVLNGLELAAPTILNINSNGSGSAPADVQAFIQGMLDNPAARAAACAMADALAQENGPEQLPGPSMAEVDATIKDVIDGAAVAPDHASCQLEMPEPDPVAAPLPRPLRKGCTPIE